MDIHTLLVIGHIAGTILGVGGATLAEVNVFTALKDKTIDASEKQMMHANYTMIRVGTALIMLSALGLIAYYLLQGNTWVLTSEKLWAKDALLIIIILNAIALTKHWIPFWLGAALSFTSWWMAAILGVMRNASYTFIEYAGTYVLAVALVALALHFLHEKR